MSTVAAHPAVALLQAGIVDDGGKLRVSAEAVDAHKAAVRALGADERLEVVSHLVALAKKAKAAGPAGDAFIALLVVLATEATGNATAVADAFHEAGVAAGSVIGKTEALRAPAAQAIVPAGAPIKAKRGLSKKD